MEDLEVEYGEVNTKFTNHINSQHNTNILFSGKYGIGKSTFLDYYFKQRKDEFYPITIRPVNYVVSTNENIFELIKIDIIKNLSDDDYLDFFAIEADKVTAGAKYFLSKPLEFTANLTKALSSLDPILDVAAKASEGVHKLIEGFSNFEAQLNEKLKSNNQLLQDHAEQFTTAPGTYLEFDIISQLIRMSLISIQDHEEKEPILIIDDLDRLDPEHIFRILNIFSAHTNHENDKNKFGFSKIIIVADIENIQILFQHRYGNGADFEGYIEKFYSDEVFSFTNDDALVTYLEMQFDSVLSGKSNKLLAFLLRIFLDQKLIRIRHIIKHKQFSIPGSFILDQTTPELHDVHSIKFIGTESIKLTSDDIEVLYLISILSTIFGSLKKLEDVISNLVASQIQLTESIKNDIVSCFAVFSIYVDVQNRNLMEVFFGSRKSKGRFLISPDLFPEGNLGDIAYKISPVWSSKKKYFGKANYFMDVVVQSDSHKVVMRLGELMILMQELIEFIKSQKLATNLHIVSD